MLHTPYYEEKKLFRFKFHYKTVSLSITLFHVLMQVNVKTSSTSSQKMLIYLKRLFLVGGTPKF